MRHAPGAPPRLDHLDMKKQPLQGAGEINRPLELGLAPGNGKFVIQQHAAGTIDDDMGLAPAIGAFEAGETVDLRS